MAARHIPFPEAGAEAYLTLTLEGAEEICTSFGESWIALVDLGLATSSPVVITRCLAAMLHGEDEHGINDAPWNMESHEIASRIRDAFYLGIKGQTPAEIAAEQAAIAQWMIDHKQDEYAELAAQALEREAAELEKEIADRIARRKAKAAMNAAMIEKEPVQ